MLAESDLLPHTKRAMRLAQRLHQLPAVAGLDWADTAAGVVCDIVGDGLCVVWLMRVQETGRVTQTDATGLSSGSDRLSAGEIGTLRAAADQVTSLGVSLPGLRSGPVVRASHADALAHPLSGVFRTPGSTPLVAAAPLGAPTASESIPSLVVGLCPADGTPRGAHRLLLTAVMPSLLERALLAFDGGYPSGARWLTQREQEVLEHLIIGKSVKQIADDLSRSQHTVHDHVKSLHRKLKASSRGELVARALGHVSRCVGIRHAGAEEREQIKPLRAQPLREVRPMPMPTLADEVAAVAEGQPAGSAHASEAAPVMNRAMSA